MTPTGYYDAVVIGAGQGGVPLARALAQAGRKTALVEREHVGGTCINEGCTPTKTMVASAKVAYFDRRSADYGVQNGPVAVDMLKIRQRKRDIVRGFRSGSERRIERTEGLDLLMGEARFTGPKELEVRLNGDGETVQLSADDIFINVGARPANPPIEGLDAVPALNSTTVMELDVVPDHLLVLGGSYVGLEFAQMFRRFGSEVTVVELGKQLMGREDAGVETDRRGFVEVNDRLETNVPGIYAMGDVKGGPAFTHISYDDFRIIRTNLLEGGDASIAERLVPYTVFIDPQLGRIGLSEQEAREQGRNIGVAKMPMSYVARAIEVDETRGFMKAVVDADTGQILGCAVLGIEGGEIMAMLQIAMMGKVPYTALRDAVFAHPTLAESLNNLFASLDETPMRRAATPSARNV